MVQAIRLHAIQGGGEARVRLRPEYLGEVVIAVKVEHGVVTASVHAATAEVRQWTQANEPLLRQALVEQGLHLERLTISGEPPKSEPGAADRRRQPPPDPNADQEPRRPRKHAGSATFEVLA